MVSATSRALALIAERDGVGVATVDPHAIRITDYRLIIEALSSGGHTQLLREVAAEGLAAGIAEKTVVGLRRRISTQLSLAGRFQQAVNVLEALGGDAEERWTVLRRFRADREDAVTSRAFLPLLLTHEPSADRSALEIGIRSRLGELERSAELLLDLPVGSDAWLRATRILFVQARRLGADQMALEIGLPLAAALGDTAPPQLLVRLFKLGAACGRIQDIAPAYTLFQTVAARIRADDDLFREHGLALTKALLELHHLEAYKIDLARLKVLDPAISTIDDTASAGFADDHAAEFELSHQQIDTLLRTGHVDQPFNEVVRIEVAHLKLLNLGDRRRLSTDNTWRAVIRETITQARARGGKAWFVPAWLAPTVRALAVPPATLSYHSCGSAPGVMHFKEADLDGYATIDPSGYAGWSSFSSKPLSALRLERVPLDEARTFVVDLQHRVISNNRSKYPQAPRGTGKAVDGGYVFVALQVITDTVQQLASIPMLEMLDMVATRFARSGTRVVVKRHPACTNPSVADALLRLSESGAIEVREDSIHDLIGGALAVMTVNSGVGSEALTHLKPVYLFGHADYQAACHLIDNEDQFFDLTSAISLPLPEDDLIRFIYVYRTEYLVDTADRNSLRRAVADRVFG